MLTKKAGAAEGNYGVRTEDQNWLLETVCHGETASASLVYLLGTRLTQQGHPVRAGSVGTCRGGTMCSPW